MRTSTQIVFAVFVIIAGGVHPAHAQQPWSVMPGACASTENNFYSGTPSLDYPVARFITPGGSLTFNQLHDGHIAVLCALDNPRYSGAQRWNQLQVTYRDPDGFLGTLYQAYVELVRVSKTTGTWASIARFDSDVQSHTIPTANASDLRVAFDNRVKTAARSFTHTFDFVNYTYAVYARLYRELPNNAPQLFQLRLQAAAVVEPPTV